MASETVSRWLNTCCTFEPSRFIDKSFAPFSKAFPVSVASIGRSSCVEQLGDVADRLDHVVLVGVPERGQNTIAVRGRLQPPADDRAALLLRNAKGHHDGLAFAEQPCPGGFVYWLRLLEFHLIWIKKRSRFGRICVGYFLSFFMVTVTVTGHSVRIVFFSCPP